MITYLITAMFGYLLGSIPFGLVLCKIFGLGDIREIGSKSIGATNVLRTGNKSLALATLLLDSGKGAIAVLITASILSDFNASMIAGLFALIGHCHPIWLKFKGGKGVATAAGTLLALVWPLGLSACAIWLLSALIFRISSLSALITAGLTPLIAHYMYDNSNLSGFCAMMATLIYIKHRPNIKRIIAGEEPKIGKKEKTK